jgi:hypothetical protein
MESRNAADLVRALYTALAAGDREQFVAAVRGGAGGGDWDCSTPPTSSLRPTMRSLHLAMERSA